MFQSYGSPKKMFMPEVSSQVTQSHSRLDPFSTLGFELHISLIYSGRNSRLIHHEPNITTIIQSCHTETSTLGDTKYSLKMSHTATASKIWHLGVQFVHPDLFSLLASATTKPRQSTHFSEGTCIHLSSGEMKNDEPDCLLRTSPLYREVWGIEPMTLEKGAYYPCTNQAIRSGMPKSQAPRRTVLYSAATTHSP